MKRQDENVEPQGHLRCEVPDTRRASDLRLAVLGIRLVGCHGVHPEEREVGNRFDVDVELKCVSLDAAKTDSLRDTIDYQQITDLVRRINRRQSFNLIESFAGAIADALLARFPLASEVAVRVSKLAPPGLGDVERAMAEITRRRR